MHDKLYKFQFELLALLLLLLLLAELLEALSTEYETGSNDRRLHTVTAIPSYMTLYQQITQIRFQCYVDSRPAKDGQIFWTRNGVTVPCIKTHRVFACENILIITKANVEDAGRYRCFLRADNNTFCTVGVIVPAFMSPQGDEKVTVFNGEDRKLDCGVSNRSYPNVSSVDWKYNGEYKTSGPILQLKNVSHNEAGVYECIAFNGYGIPASKKFHISVHDVGETSKPTLIPAIVQVTDNTQMGTKTTLIISSAKANSPLCLLFVVLWLIKQVLIIS